ncbi:MAG: peptidyl-prolyl cis-trans isomerase, partial [Cyclobacteriaceae bacterium]|nr:peptidyl-prolyl cis-trans isomerase [Cyclobacteriaceae bacterium]
MIIALYPFVAFPIALFAQDILFTIDHKPVYSEEFIHVYRKNNINNKDAFSKKDIDEYLTLFINFKLRVHEAYQQKLDTIISLNNEYESYKEQLRKPYLTDQKVTDALLKEAYDRYKFDIKASHILIRVSPNANPDDTLKAYQKIQDIRNMATSGKSFSDLARQYSEDPGGRENGGELGYFSALQMVYPFETAAYNTSVGEISTPVRTRFGYHLIKIEDKKLSAGKIQVAHIMIRNIPNQSVDEITSTRDKIFSVYDQLKAGYPWDDVCKL